MALVPNSSHAAAEQRDLEPQHRGQRHDHHVDQPDQAVRQQLADDQLPACDRRDVQLLERAQLLLAHDRHRRQVRRDHQQQQRDDAGDHEVAALELRVEPDADARLDRPRRQRPCQPRSPAARCQLLVVGGDEVGGIAQRDAGRIRVGAVGHDLHRRGPPVAQRVAIVARDRQRHPRAAPLEPRIDVVEVVGGADDGEVRRGVEARDQLAASRGSVLIDDDHRHVAHVGGRRVAEHRQLDDRRDEDHAEQPRVLPQLQQLLPHDVPEAPHVRPTPFAGGSRPGR